MLGEILVGVLLGKSALGLIGGKRNHKGPRGAWRYPVALSGGLRSRHKSVKKVGIKAFIVAFVGAVAPMLLGFW